MKTNFIKKLVLGTTALAAIFGMVANIAAAFGMTTINQDSQDLKTVRVSNYSATPGSMNWGSSVNAASGQIISVGIYYHNSGANVAENLRIKLSPQSTGVANSHVFSATISSNNSNTVTDSATVNSISGPQSLSFIPAGVLWYPNQICKTNPNCQPVALPNGQTGSELFGAGLNLGNIAPGWSTQGGLVVQFKVSSSGTITGQAPTVATHNPGYISNAGGEVLLKGWFDANGSSTQTWFRYKRNNGSWIETSKQNNGIGDGNITRNLTGLASGDYEYQAMASNQHGTRDGGSKYFTITNDIDPVDELPEVSTDDESSVDEDSATLNGSLDDTGNDTVTLWFEYGTDENDLDETVNAGSRSSTGSFSENISGLDEDTEYFFRACGENDEGQDCGSIKSFVTGEDDGGGTGDDEPTVQTESATNIDEDSATLRGDLEDDGNSRVELWFEYGTDEDDLDDRINAGSKSSTGTFSKNVSGLDEGTRYYFRACGENDEGEDCGSIKSFVTDGDDDRDDTDLPSVTTLGTLAIGATVATIDGYFDANGCSTTTYFQYGRTAGLGSQTMAINRGNGSGSMAYSFTSLAPNTTYFYRAVASNCEGTNYGAVRSFTTRTTVITEPPVIINTGTGGGSFIRLMITNNRDTVRGGKEIGYDVSWENISNRDLTDVILEINFPEQMTVTDTDEGDITHEEHSVIVEISELDRREKGEMTVFAEIDSRLTDGDMVVVQAVMAFENPTTEATENAIAYDSDEYIDDGSVLGASIFGLSLPTSLAGWLLIILIILVLILIARSFMKRDGVMVQNNAAPANPTNGSAPAATANDYIVYRPNPKQ